jgi:hypothetical protein
MLDNFILEDRFFSYIAKLKAQTGACAFNLAERTGFEPARDLHLNTLSRRAP